MGKVFISYAREDFDIAERLYRDLTDAGATPWMDVKNIVAGKRWKSAIQREIRESSVIIVLLSSRALSKRGFVQKEINQALEVWSEVPPDKIYLIPVRVDECTPRHDQLQEIQWVNLFPSYELGLQEIKRALEAAAVIPINKNAADPALQTDMTLLRDIVTSAREAIYALDQEGHYKWCNQAMLEMTSSNVEQIIDHHFLELTHEDDLEMREFKFAEVLGGEPQSFELRYRLKDGSVRLTSVYAAPILVNGENKGVLEIAHDITLQKEERDRAARDDKLRALGQLASGVAHDFNSSLVAILGRAELLSRQVKDAAALRHLGIIITAAEDAAAVVRRIQAFSGSAAPRDRECDLLNVSGLLNDAIEITRTRWQNEARIRGLEYRVTLEADEGLLTNGSAMELREVFVNLIVNAVDAMPGGGILAIGCRRENNWVRLWFKDTGTGIKPEVIEHIFEPFFTTKGVHGTGLGLAICYTLIKRHQGHISVESKPGQGTTFCIDLAIAEQR
jgi:PAS domain S-box-containing protein